MISSTLPVGGRPRSTSEVDRDDASDGEVETDDGPGIAWNVSCRHRPSPLEGHRYAVPNRAGRPTDNLPEAPLPIGRSDDAEAHPSRYGVSRDEELSGTKLDITQS